jgi:hypothetical protein
MQYEIDNARIHTLGYKDINIEDAIKQVKKLEEDVLFHIEETIGDQLSGLATMNEIYRSVNILKLYTYLNSTLVKLRDATKEEFQELVKKIETINEKK